MLAIIFLGVGLALFAAVADFSQTGLTTTSRRINEQAALRLAEAGIEKAVWCLNNPTDTTSCPGNPSYAGESNVALGNGAYSVTVTGSGNSRTVEATGQIAGSGGTTTRQIRTRLTTTTTDVAFHYGVQVGQGGLEMGNNAEVVGNVYSNGSIIAGNNARVRGSAFVAGGTQLTPDQEQAIQTGDQTVGYPAAQEDAAQSFRAGDSNFLNKISLYVRKIGTPSNATVRIVTDNAGSPSTNQITSGTLNESQVTGTYGWIDVTFTSNPPLVNNTTYWIVLDASGNSSRHYVWGKHDNSGYGNGIGVYTSNWNGGTWADANGDFAFRTYLGGVVTKISNLTVPNTTGASVRANTIEVSNIGTGTDPGVDTFCATMTGTTVSGNVQCGATTLSTITGNVTTETISSSTVTGNLTCESYTSTTVSGAINCPTLVTPPADLPPENLPISQANIAQWKADAALGGQHVGDLNVTANTSLGPREITGNLILGTNGTVLTITGTLFVRGNIDISNGATIHCAAAYGDTSCLIVADGWIHIENNGQFSGSGNPASFVLLLTTLNCTGSGGTNCTHHSAAVDVHKNDFQYGATGVIFYAGQGMIHLHNNVSLSEATAYKLQLDNEAVITYQQGLATAQFSSGPGGSWTYQRGTYQILD